MNLLEQVEGSEFIGRDFLVWLWFKSETNDGIIELEEVGFAEIVLEGKLTLETEGADYTESITCSGSIPLLKEARFALTQNKKPTLAGIRLIMGDDEFLFSLDSRWMNYKALKTPRIMEDYKDDPDGLFYEKFGLIEKAVSMMDSVFIHFIKLRLSETWTERESPDLMNWINKGKE